MKPQVTVVLPTYQRKFFLKSAISSVLNQTFQDFELIVVDDGSTDGTDEIVRSFDDRRVVYIYQRQNAGPSSARNTGIDASRANLVAFLDSDDVWKRNKLEIQLQRMTEEREFLFSHTEELWLKDGKVLNPRKVHRKRGGWVFEQSLRLCAISMSTVMVRKQLFDEVGKFDEALRVCEDYDMWLRVTCRYPVLLVPHVLTVKHGGHPDQVSKSTIGLDKYRIYSIEKLLNSSVLSDENYTLAVKELKRKCLIYGRGCVKHGKEKEGRYYLELYKKYEEVKG